MTLYPWATPILSILMAATAAAQPAPEREPIVVELPTLQGQPCERHAPHIYIGGQLMGIGAVAQSAFEADRYLGRFGGGIGLFAGSRLGPRVALEGNWTFALHDEALVDMLPSENQSIYLMTVTADIKIYQPTSSPMEPYLQLGGGLLLSGSIALDDRDVNTPSGFSVGATFTLGGGLDIWVTKHLSFGGRVLYRGLALGEPRDDQDQRFRNLVHGISVDAYASVHF
ncbi:MAG: outer membrane beta-barrel protein [Deltaproteobacteria bacterium]|nr:outer membrane beta-barrel protein [Deltaproteobacteria bacterium]